MTDSDVRLDIGGGSSARLHASVRLRRVTVRFTEPGVRDLSLVLHSVAWLRPLAFEVVFDADTSTSSSPDASEASVGELAALLTEAALMGDETVGAIKRHMVAARDGLAGRRLRLIHAGRMLRDGVHLVAYLDELDERTRVHARQTLRQIALDKSTVPTSLHAAGSDDDSGQEEVGVDGEGAERVERREMRVRELVEWLTELHSHADDGPHTAASTRRGKGKAREPAWFDDVVRVSTRTATPVYLQCSVGDLISTSPSVSMPVHEAVEASEGDGEEERRGFGRLLDAGLSAEEVEAMRMQFRSTQRVGAYDLIRSREHAQHLLELEESWMDGFTTAAPEEASAPYTTVLRGLLVGFFLPPLIPLFWFRDRAHPSSIPTAIADEPDHDADDEHAAIAEHHALTREAVFDTTMQIAILCGLIANLTMGVFRFIW